MTYDPTKSLGARLHAASREALGHTDRIGISNFSRLPPADQTYWERAAINFVSRLSDAPDLAAIGQARKALAAWDRYQPNVDRAETVEQACAMAAALRRLLNGEAS